MTVQEVKAVLNDAREAGSKYLNARNKHKSYEDLQTAKQCDITAQAQNMSATEIPLKNHIARYLIMKPKRTNAKQNFQTRIVRRAGSFTL